MRTTGTLNLFVNLKKDLIDDRDYVATTESDEKLPLDFDLYKYVGEIKNQGKANSCTAHAVVTAFEIEYKYRGLWLVEGSEQYNYYYSRVLSGLFPQDDGAYLRDACKVLQKYGNAPEKLMPYNVYKINDKPGVFAEGFARLLKITQYSRLIDIDSMKHNIYHGHPVIIGLPIWDEFLNAWAKSRISGLGIGKPKGRHAVLLIGYNDVNKEFLLLNSWGKNWGINGVIKLPYSYLKCDYDAWVLRI